jgi:hypothetical protein
MGNAVADPVADLAVSEVYQRARLDTAHAVGSVRMAVALLWERCIQLAPRSELPGRSALVWPGPEPVIDLRRNLVPVSLRSRVSRQQQTSRRSRVHLASPPMSPALHAALDSLVATIRDELRTEFMDLIGGGPRGTAKPKRRVAPLAPRTPRVAKARRKGGRRSPEELQELATGVLGYIRKNPGQRAEQIAAGMSTTTKELARPISMLLADKAVKTQGVKRGTTYTAK